MRRIARESLPSIVAALVVAGLLGIFPAARNLIWGLVSVEFTTYSGVLVLAFLLSLLLGGVITYGLLKGTIESGKTDPMTKSLRAGQIDPFLQRRIQEAKAGRSSFAVLLVDIDNFKRINDEYNHEIGNHTLAELVEVIRPRSKGEEIFRYGGDEFLIVTNLGVDERGCWGYANRILREVAEYDFLGEVNSPDRVKLTVSCGCVVPRGEEDIRTIRENLATALKKAKEPNEKSPGGKNAAYLYSATIAIERGITA